MPGARDKYFSHLESIVKVLPNKPGVYQFFDDKNKIIYVGKAKDLKKRVSSYFAKINSHSGKVQMLVRKIADIKFIVVSTEQDALLLEKDPAWRRVFEEEKFRIDGVLQSTGRAGKF